MLPETTFTFGGLLCLAMAGLFAVTYIVTDAWGFAPMLGVVPVLFGVFGAIFLGTARQARRDRRSLLELAHAGRPPPEREPR